MSEANPFESGARKVIPAVLVYLRTGEGHSGKTLMMHRVVKAQDVHQGKWNGLGGKCEADESPQECARREIEEEAGIALDLSRFRPLGVLQFPFFKAHKAEDWVVFVFAAEISGEEAARIPAQCAEGKLNFVPDDEVLSLNLWAGDKQFLPNVLQNKPFVGTFWYENGELARSWFASL